MVAQTVLQMSRRTSVATGGSTTKKQSRPMEAASVASNNGADVAGNENINHNSSQAANVPDAAVGTSLSGKPVVGDTFSTHWTGLQEARKESSFRHPAVYAVCSGRSLVSLLMS
mgnify:CR=1 FL=1